MPSELKRSMGKFDVFSLALGAIIGWGAFMLPGNTFLKTAGIVNTIIGLGLGALIMIVIEKNYGYMIEKYPVSGGEYAYAYNVLGRKHGFITGWFLGLAYLAIVPLNATAFSLMFRSVVSDVLAFGYLYNVAGYPVYLGEVLVSSILLIVFSYLNIKGVNISSLFQKIMTVLLVGIVFGMFFILLVAKNFRTSELMSYFGHGIDWSSVIVILSMAPWAYVGFDTVPQVAEELNFSSKKASLLAIFSIVFGFMIYNILNFITATLYTPEMLSNKQVIWATGEAITYWFGKIGLYALSIALAAAVIGGINGFILATSRLLYAMGKAHAISPSFGKLHSQNNTPKNAILFILVFSLVAPWFGREALGWIVSMSSIGAAIAYGYTSFVVWKLVKNTKYNNIYKITSILGTIFGILFVAILLFPSSPGFLPKPSLISLVIWSILGVIFYIKNEKRYSTISNEKLDEVI